MPRDLPIGNGNMLVAFDSRYHLRELYYPYVGQANHTLGHWSRFGVWVDGRLSWVHEPSWGKELRYEPDTLVTCVRLVNAEIGIALTCSDCVDYDENIFLRRIDVENLHEGTQREVRLFFHHDLDIGGTWDGDTAFYHPSERALIHYKGRHWFLINAMTARVWGLSSFATGVAGHHGTEGTWRDAEDGVLGRNPIMQGSVDSTGAVHVTVKDTATVYYWIGVGENMTEVLRLNQLVRDLEPETILSRVRAYWRQWVSLDRLHLGLPEPVRTFYRRSLLILRTQIDNHGAILAANDSDALDYNCDSYSYLWPRDGALVTRALDLAGYHDISQRYFAFCSKLLTPEGYFMHKYNPDGSVGSSWHPWCGPDGLLQLPIQEDETALMLYALWEHYTACRDIDFVRTLYGELIERAGDFLYRFRDVRTHLPEPSWDLWEERRGIHLFTVSAVYAGLAAAANFAEIFGDGRRADRFCQAAGEIKEAAIRFLFDPERGRFVRALVQQDRNWVMDCALDSSQAGVFLFGMLPAEDPRVASTMEAIAEQLWCHTDVGGIARYQADPFYRIVEDTHHVPGNPWFIGTMWLAQWYIATAETREDLEKPMELIRWVMAHAWPSGVLAEQLNPITGEPISVAPLTWSHATFVTTVCKWEEAFARLTDRRKPPR